MNRMTHIGGGYIGRNLFDLKTATTNSLSWDGEKLIVKGDSSLHRVANLGFDDIKTWYTVSGYFSSNKPLNIYINICDASTKPVSINQTPKFISLSQFVLYYTDITGSDENPSDKTTGYNGFLDFEGWNDYETEVYVKDLKIERGRKPTTFVPSLETLSVPWIKPNLVNGTVRYWSSWFNIPDGFGDELTSTLLRFESTPGKEYTSFVELWFRGIKRRDDSDQFLLRFCGDVNSPYRYLMEWTEPPQDGTYKFRYNRMINSDYYQPEEIYLQTYASGIDLGGQFRYKTLTVKEGNIPNPIWCFSEIDEANPNIAVYNGTNSSTQTFGTFEVTDCPNRYITDGTWYIRKENSLQSGSVWVVSPENYITSYYTLSFYSRAEKEDAYLSFGTDQWYLNLDNIQTVTKNYQVFGEYVPGDYIWRKYECTFFAEDLKTIIENIGSENISSIPERLPIVIYIKNSLSRVDICGVKVEYGKESTPFVPNISSQILEDFQKKIDDIT